MANKHGPTKVLETGPWLKQLDVSLPQYMYFFTSCSFFTVFYFFNIFLFFLFTSLVLSVEGWLLEMTWSLNFVTCPQHHLCAHLLTSSSWKTPTKISCNSYICTTCSCFIWATYVNYLLLEKCSFLSLATNCNDI